MSKPTIANKQVKESIENLKETTEQLSYYGLVESPGYCKEVETYYKNFLNNKLPKITQYISQFENKLQAYESVVERCYPQDCVEGMKQLKQLSKEKNNAR